MQSSSSVVDVKTVMLPTAGSYRTIFRQLGFKFPPGQEINPDGVLVRQVQLPQGWTMRTSHNDRPNTYDFFDPLGQRRVVTRYRSVDGVLAMIPVTCYYPWIVVSPTKLIGDRDTTAVHGTIRKNSEFANGHPQVLISLGQLYADSPDEIDPKKAEMNRRLYAWLDLEYPDYNDFREYWRTK